MSKMVYLILLFALIGCEQFNFRREIKCELVDYFSGEPLPDVFMNFDVAKGSGLFGSLERGKYNTRSREDGKFTIDAGKDSDATLYVNFVTSWIPDSSTLIAHYLLEGSHEDSLWIAKGVNQKLRLRPAGYVNFFHPRNANSNVLIDSISIESYHQKIWLRNDRLFSETLHVLPSQTNVFTITYFYNGTSQSFAIERYIEAAYTQGPLGARVFNKVVIQLPSPVQ